jgi:putative endonuclease
MNYFYTYVLRSVEFERNYVGFTHDVEKRLKEHNSGKTILTRPYKPWYILFSERFSTKVEALRREKFLKTGQGRDYIKKILVS